MHDKRLASWVERIPLCTVGDRFRATWTTATDGRFFAEISRSHPRPSRIGVPIRGVRTPSRSLSHVPASARTLEGLENSVTEGHERLTCSAADWAVATTA